MELLKLLFWIMIFTVVYTYIGYGMILYVLVKIKRWLRKNKHKEVYQDFQPEVTLFIPAYNEIDYVDQKMKNTMELDYPKDKLKIYCVTDGSDDGTDLKLKEYDNIHLFHKPERNGKINAMNRVMPLVNTPIVVFSDANTLLGKELY